MLETTGLAGLAGQAQDAGFKVQEIGFIWPVFDKYRWLPSLIISGYQQWMERLDDIPGVRRFGVSTLVIATKPVEA